MRLEPSDLDGVWIVETEPARDGRGLFARTFCAETFRRHGLEANVSQRSVSWNAAAGTLRGLHWQAPPHGEAKLVRCTRGRLYDVAVDVRAGSPGFGQWTAVELDAESRRAVYISAGFAHGFLTLVDDTEVDYAMSAPFVAEAARGIRWDDARLAIAWPAAPRVISERDRALPDLGQVFGPAAVGRAPADTG